MTYGHWGQINPMKEERKQPRHRLKGDWTGANRQVLGNFLTAYTTAPMSYNFDKAHIDAFAGTGS